MSCCVSLCCAFLLCIDMSRWYTALCWADHHRLEKQMPSTFRCHQKSRQYMAPRAARCLDNASQQHKTFIQVSEHQRGGVEKTPLVQYVHVCIMGSFLHIFKSRLTTFDVHERVIQFRTLLYQSGTQGKSSRAQRREIVLERHLDSCYNYHTQSSSGHGGA